MYNSSIFASGFGLLLLLAGVIASAYFRLTLIAAFLLLVLLLCAGACLWSRNVLHKTTVSIADGQTACHAGDSMPLTLIVRSRSFFPLIWLDVTVPLGHTLILKREGDESPQLETLPYERPLYGMHERFAWLLWQQEITCEETLTTLRRGVVRVERASLQAGDGLGMAAQQRWQTLERPIKLVVYPKLVPVDVRVLTRQITDAEAGARGQTEDITLLRSIRPYQVGDPMKRINWRQLAASGRMEVNQYETITPGCITFLLDLFSFRYREVYETPQGTKETRLALHRSALERMLSVLASVLRAMHEQGLRFALVIPGYAETPPVICPPGSDEATLYQALEALAEIDYAAQDVLLPADELRRYRRKLGVLHLCAYTDAPTLLGDLESLSFARLRAISCQRDAQAQRAGEIPCLLLDDLTIDPAEEGGGA